MTHSHDPAAHRPWVIGLLEEYEAKLFQYALRISRGDREISHDAVQHVFLKLCDQSKSDLEERMPGWLFRVCRNKIIDERRMNRRQSKQTQVPERDASRSGTEPPDVAEQAELSLEVIRQVERLPVAQREAITLWSQGWKYREIAEITGKSYVAVRVNVHRAIEQLRRAPAFASEVGSGMLGESNAVG